jgi:hypothetical protein
VQEGFQDYMKKYCKISYINRLSRRVRYIRPRSWPISGYGGRAGYARGHS